MTGSGASSSGVHCQFSVCAALAGNGWTIPPSNREIAKAAVAENLNAFRKHDKIIDISPVQSLVVRHRLPNRRSLRSTYRLHALRHYEPWWQRAESELTARIETVLHDGNHLFNSRLLLNGSGERYRVFTPWFRKQLEHMPPPAPLAAPEHVPPPGHFCPGVQTGRADSTSGHRERRALGLLSGRSCQSLEPMRTNATSRRVPECRGCHRTYILVRFRLQRFGIMPPS